MPAECHAREQQPPIAFMVYPTCKAGQDAALQQRRAKDSTSLCEVGVPRGSPRQRPVVPAKGDVAPGEHGVRVGLVEGRGVGERGREGAQRRRHVRQPVQLDGGDACAGARGCSGVSRRDLWAAPTLKCISSRVAVPGLKCTE